MVAPLTYEALIGAVTSRHPSMSRRFQQIARHVVQNPNDVALGSVKSIATGAGVQPSSLVRFAQSFGYTGFAEMQRVFQARLVTAAPGIKERIHALKGELGHGSSTSGMATLRDLVIADIAGLEHLLDSLSEDTLTAAVDLLAKARTVYLLGQLRAYPVAVYLRYALIHLRRDVRLLDGAGGLATEQSQLMGAESVLLVISFRHYAREVVDIVEAAEARDVPIVAITDSQLSPLAKRASVCMVVPDGEYNYARSLAEPICLAQALIICLARRLDIDPESAEALAESGAG